MEAQKVDPDAAVSLDTRDYQKIDMTGFSKGVGGFENK